MNSTMPEWRIPPDLEALVRADEDLTWTSHVWAPIELTVMAGTEYAGREIPMAWQIEFEPNGPGFEEPNAKLSEMGLDPDGYGWSSLIASVMKKYHPEVADELQYGDTEESACVIWVESEKTCRRLVEVAWTLIHA
jgi:hypothetical protein